ncbi:Galactoside 2-alpha-L-fucosyltransferase [Ancistrocladus abbreviatus]
MQCMDLNAIRKRLSPSKPTDPASINASRIAARKLGCNGTIILRTFAALLIVLPVFVTLSIVYRSPHPDRGSPFAEARVLGDKSLPLSTSQSLGSVNGSMQLIELPRGNLLGGLLAPGFDEKSCLSRYQSALYRKPSPYMPSSYLLSKLRKYEEMHKHCGPHTKSYNEALRQLKSGHTSAPTDCQYIVWISFSGLGNRILTLASAFLYALLTNRILLVDPGTDMTDLFCEPFPEMSWFLPSDFPLKKQFNEFNQKSPQCHGYMLKNSLLKSSVKTVPSYLYVHLVHDYDDYDKLFFCEEDQNLLEKVPWLILKTDNYFVPSLFLIPSFEQELSRLFPEKIDLFHHLGRYLLHPTNQVWGLITRYYDSYLAKADETIGIQIRTFDTGKGPFQHVKNQILACILQERLLPEINKQDSYFASSKNPKSKAVLTTSLNSGYYEMLRDMYWEYPTITGEVIAIFQPSHEEFQQSEKKIHNRKAWAEMYLLSLTDKLVTSAWSTFGYVAQGLGGLKPWILYKSENKTTPNPPCARAMSMEPCFHAPPFWDCKAKKGIDTGVLVPHVRHCEDISWGLKLVSGHDEF